MAYTPIDKSDDYFNTVLWTGNATDNRSITGVNFQPDLVWYKERSSTSWHNLQDVVRGVGKQIHSNSTEPETTNTGTIKAFQTDGFQIGTEADINENGQTYVAWNWLAGGTAVSNTDGSITSSVSANTTSGFSIATFTGNGTGSATIGHGLGSAPKFVIIKNRGRAGESWQTWFDNDKRLNLNSTSVSFISTHPISTSSTVVTTPSTVDAGWNLNNDTYVMYSFAEKKGFSKFGSYTGNGSTNGSYIHLGFKPAWVMIKRTDVIKNWYLIDNKRENYNPNHETTILFANSSNAEQTLPDREVDFLSNGFKLRGSDGDVNASGGTYIYMAFAESPFTTSTGIPTTAR